MGLLRRRCRSRRPEARCVGLQTEGRGHRRDAAGDDHAISDAAARQRPGFGRDPMMEVDQGCQRWVLHEHCRAGVCDRGDRRGLARVKGPHVDLRERPVRACVRRGRQLGRGEQRIDKRLCVGSSLDADQCLAGDGSGPVQGGDPRAAGVRLQRLVAVLSRGVLILDAAVHRHCKLPGICVPRPSVHVGQARVDPARCDSR